MINLWDHVKRKSKLTTMKKVVYNQKFVFSKADIDDTKLLIMCQKISMLLLKLLCLVRAESHQSVLLVRRRQNISFLLEKYQRVERIFRKTLPNIETRCRSFRVELKHIRFFHRST